MKKVKILHCSDLHFDTPFRELNSRISERSKEELLEVFNNIINLTIKENVQVLLIAGDLFDNLMVNKNTLFFIHRVLQKISHVKVFISPGNHDPYNENAFYKMIDWPENVYIFKGKMEQVEVKELNLILWGCGFNNSYVNETLIDSVKVDKSKINIMVAHGEIENGNSKNEYNPIYLKDIEASNMDYIALGHRHNYSGIQRVGKTSYSYSGCPQGRGFDESGEKGVVLGEVYIGGTSLEFIPICKRKYITRKINISSSNSYEEVIEKIISNCNEYERLENLFKVILVGNIREEFTLNENILNEKIKDKFYYLKIINNTSIDIDLDDIAKDYSIKGKFVAEVIKLLETASDEEREILEMALKLGIQCLSDEGIIINDY